MSKPLNAKQQRFVEEYLVDLNATQAAIRAGYEFTAPDGYYVYLLTDPQDGVIFYVGKGKGKRMLSHERAAQRGQIDNPAKFDRIQAINERGMRVDHLVFASGLSDDDAYALESHLIDLLKHHGLTNIARGIEPSGMADLRKAQEMLKRLKPFNCWVEGLRPDQMETVTTLWGTPEHFYATFKSNLEKVAAAC